MRLRRNRKEDFMEKKILWIIALVAILTMAFIGCKDDDTPTPETFTVHTHDFSGAWHMDATHHWKECPSDGMEGLKATHSPADGVCTVCGYDNTPDLTGTITISPNTGDIYIGTELTATYSENEEVSFQWKKDGENVGTDSNKFTPSEAGNYTVTVSATGYKPKVSAAVTIAPNNPQAVSFAEVISNYSGGTGTLTATVQGNIITVTGTVENVVWPDRLMLNIPEGVTMRWEAELSGPVDYTYVYGSGTLEIVGGFINHLILAGSNTIRMTGGSINPSGVNGISVRYNAPTIVISGGTITGYVNYDHNAGGTITITGSPSIGNNNIRIGDNTTTVIGYYSDATTKAMFGDGWTEGVNLLPLEE